MIGGGGVLALLTLAIWAAVAQAGPADAGQGILFLNPNPVVSGGTVKASGSGFCADPGCSDVTITTGSNVLASGIEVQASGTFVVEFSALLELGLHTVTASQISGGQTVSASTELSVTVSDSATAPPMLTQTIPPPTPTAQPTPPNASPTPTSDLRTPEPTPTTLTGEDRPSIELRPATTEPGEDVTVTGQDFCAAPGCTSVTVSLNGGIPITGISVDRDGGFEHQIEAPSAPGQYQVVASQSDEQGRELTAEATLTIESRDSSDGGGGVPWYAWFVVALALGVAVSAAVVYWRRRPARS
jgi:hypothetical protein